MHFLVASTSPASSSAFTSPTTHLSAHSRASRYTPSPALARLQRATNLYHPMKQNSMSHARALTSLLPSLSQPQTRTSTQLHAGPHGADYQATPPGHIHDLAVIGGGPGGYTGAIAAQKHGLDTVCIEASKLGGICLNHGCIPTKNLLAAAEFYHKAKHEAHEWGLVIDNVDYQWEKVIAQKSDVVANLNKGIGYLFQKNGVDHVEGYAFIESINLCEAPDGSRFSSIKIIDPMRVKALRENGLPLSESLAAEPALKTINAKNILLATGARPRPMPNIPFDGDKIISYKEALALKERPDNLIIVGTGAIGTEFASFFNAFGTNVTLIARGPHILSIEDREVSKTLHESLEAQGIRIITNRVLSDADTSGEGVTATLSPSKEGGESQNLKADKILVAMGVIGNTEGLFPEEVPYGLDTGLDILPETKQIALNRDTFAVDYTKPGTGYETNLPNVFAIGDVIGSPKLAHVAAFEAETMVKRLAGVSTPDIDYKAIPGCTYCSPQVASIGATEESLTRDNIPYKASKFPFVASGKAQALHKTEGFVKILSKPDNGDILGIHMIGEGVAELSGEMSLAMRLGATVDEIIHTIHAHPTLTEAVHEAALGAYDQQIHF